jgi:hypothetical protein
MREMLTVAIAVPTSHIIKSMESAIASTANV